MANRLFRCLYTDLISVNNQQIRYGHRIRGKPPNLARTIEQRLEELKYKDPELYYNVDIGLPLSQKSNKQMFSGWMNQVAKNREDPALEKKVRNREHLIDLEVAKEDWLKTAAPTQMRTIADHYGIFNDLYGEAYFHPVVPLTIDYNFGDPELLARVHRGNLITPSEASNLPEVNYEAEPDTLWTLLLTTPDGNLSNPESEYCHWFIGNIPGNAVEKGEQLVDYLRPIPPRGIGYCRYIFVLYKQDKKIDFSEYKKQQPCLELVERNWSTLDFYRKHQDYLTPAGLSFFQTEWDTSLLDFYHNTLKMRSPQFEYDFPKPYIKPQVWFPIRQAFNIYMDKYRDPKDINKQYFMQKLKKIHPFKEPEKPLKYPNAVRFKDEEYIPSWLKLEIRKERLGWGRYREVQK
ncbi:39S ribosomal protein L38, mitochondrial [Belonocnema kinseyi]|uniref:39S ribosomal protein L38, mitochondrial n=1 Tax=Belonocnema kinseyi TaxID=2817044 RepID=UPI00143D12E1|nr:39S ribosomal protein L38, mitochondrial [Belonocnema kinseyi]XP_033223401.1 39S ribosomal protein L38, mitochondrial [Belonocnema kinseyi]